MRAYHEVLLWDIAGRQPMATVTKLADRLANPVIGKSIIVYATKPVRHGAGIPMTTRGHEETG